MTTKIQSLNHVGKYNFKQMNHGPLCGPATGVAANVTVKAVGYGAPIAVAGVIAATVPGGTAIVATTLNMCNASGITASYIAGVAAASRVAGLIGLMMPTP